MPSSVEAAVWLDGAHNPDKIAALAREASLVSCGESPPVVVLGILKSKNAAAIAAGIAPLATAIIATEPIVVGRTPLLASELVAAVVAAGFTGRVFAVPDPQSALQHAEMLAHSNDASVVATGSMYLAGQLRGRWYPDEEIVLQRTPWPALPVASAQALPERSVAL
jgi:dihydrofolate synthase/folylpolyglutamate synthase